MDAQSQLTEITEQLRSISGRLGHIEDKLMLVTDIDRYSKLQEFLKEGKFKEADIETSNVILTVAGENQETFTPNHMLAFPCDVLQVIDRLWKTYSKEQFGFSVQLGIYQNLGGNIDTLRNQDAELFMQLGEETGWRKNGEWQDENYEQWDFSLNAPIGCFPANVWKTPYGLKMVFFCLTRLLECDIV